MSSVPFIIIAFAAIQMVIATIITRRNKDIFDRYPSYQYLKAWNQLRKRNPSMAGILMLMYVLMPIEYVVAVLFHKLGY